MESISVRNCHPTLIFYSRSHMCPQTAYNVSLGVVLQWDELSFGTIIQTSKK